MTTNHIAASGTDEVRNEAVSRDENNSCAITHRATYVLADDGIDGPLWHLAADVDEGEHPAGDEIETECGLKVIRWRADDVREEDDRPELSGTTICYGCVRGNGGGSR